MYLTQGVIRCVVIVETHVSCLLVLQILTCEIFKFILFLHNDHVCSGTGDAADANLNNQEEQLAAQRVPEPAPSADIADQGMLVMPFTYKWAREC